MYAVSTINKINAEAATKAQAEAAPKGSYTIRPNGDILVVWQPAGKRRVSKTLSGSDADEFQARIRLATTKTGKIPQRTVDRIVEDICAPAPVFEASVNPADKTVVVTKRRDHDILGRRTLGPRLSKRFLAERDGITVSPERAPKKYKAAVSNLAAGYFKD